MAMDPRPGEKKVFGEIWTSRRGDKFHKLVFSVPEIIGGFGKMEYGYPVADDRITQLGKLLVPRIQSSLETS